MKKTDIIVALVIGELIALLSFGILKNLGLEAKLLYWIWPVFLPVFCLTCLYIAHILSQKIKVFWQLAKFVLVGVLNTIIDLGILNLLMLFSGVVLGPYYSFFKGISFVAATTNSYFWNKFWTFEKKKAVKPKKEFLQFFVISAIGFAINVGTASIIVNLVDPQFNLNLAQWANFGAITASFVGLTWNFLGYKFIVFKK
ncbi:GtrA family protein [Candidatus Parcubacteria bacterium]|nr:GtrA family protein [Candidatus Parcubacteria bacterium]